MLGVMDSEVVKNDRDLQSQLGHYVVIGADDLLDLLIDTRELVGLSDVLDDLRHRGSAVHDGINSVEQCGLRELGQEVLPPQDGAIDELADGRVAVKNEIELGWTLGEPQQGIQYFRLILRRA